MSRPITCTVESDIGFADGELVSYSRTSDGEAVVSIRAWNEREIQLSFDGVIAVVDHDVGEIADVVCDHPRAEEVLYAAIGRLYEKRPNHHPYRSYSFFNSDEEAVLVIVAERHEISYPQARVPEAL